MSKTTLLLEELTRRLYAVRNATVFDMPEKAIALAEATREVLRDLDARIAAIESGSPL